MSGSLEPVFSPAVIARAARRALLVAIALPAAAVILGVVVAWLLGGGTPGLVAKLGGAAVAVGLLYAVQDGLFLGSYNRRLRAALEAKLRALGELDFRLDDPAVYFVGLAHPSRAVRRRAETDDDIGFLRLDYDRLVFRGDRLHFEVDLADVESLELVPVGHGLPSSIKRLRLRFRHGEPFEEVELCSREGDRLSRANRVTRTLAEGLEHRLKRAASRPAAERLGARAEVERETLRTDR